MMTEQPTPEQIAEAIKNELELKKKKKLAGAIFLFVTVPLVSTVWTVWTLFLIKWILL